MIKIDIYDEDGCGANLEVKPMGWHNEEQQMREAIEAALRKLGYKYEDVTVR